MNICKILAITLDRFDFFGDKIYSNEYFITNCDNIMLKDENISTT